MSEKLCTLRTRGGGKEGGSDYAVINSTVGAGPYPSSRTYTNNSNVYTVSADGNTTSSTVTVLEEGLYMYTAIAQVRGIGTASVSIGSQTIATSPSSSKVSGEMYISANTVCTASCGNVSATSSAMLVLLKKS